MKKAFTLVELLAVITLLGIIGLIVYPGINKVIKHNKEELYQAQIEKIITATENWAYENISLLPTNNESVTLTLLELKKSGHLPLNVSNPITSEQLPNDMLIKITSSGNKYIYEVLTDTGSNLTLDIKAPTLVLNGSPLEYVEINSDYEEKGAVAKDGITVNTSYQYNNNYVTSISTNDYKTYTVIYSATIVDNDKSYTSTITRTVIIRDTTPPIITLPSDVTITNINSFDPLSGVSASDNSNESISVSVSDLDKNSKEQIISYKACDSHNNCTTKRRIIKVEGD